MAPEAKKKEIDDFVYEVTPLPFGIGHKALLRFLKIAAPVMASVMEKRGTTELAAAAAIRMIPAILSEDDITHFSSVFGKYTRYQSGDKWVPLVAENQELHFAGRYSAFFGWLAFCVEVNFSSFFGDLIKQAGGVADRVPDMMATTRSTSIQNDGLSGES